MEVYMQVKCTDYVLVERWENDRKACKVIGFIQKTNKQTKRIWIRRCLRTSVFCLFLFCFYVLFSLFCFWYSKWNNTWPLVNRNKQANLTNMCVRACVFGCGVKLRYLENQRKAWSIRESAICHTTDFTPFKNIYIVYFLILVRRKNNFFKKNFFIELLFSIPVPGLLHVRLLFS